MNNRRHAPIGLEDVWATKWWPHRQFTFICSMAEVNANNSIARARDSPADHEVVFRKKLAEEMMYNKLTESGGVRSSPVRAKRRGRESITATHQLETWPLFAASYDRSKKKWGKSKQKYCKQKRTYCKNNVRTYCTCDIGLPMCTKCHSDHCIAMALRDA